MRELGESSPRVSDFYSGKSIFVTGASGFIGTVLLETLLRHFLGIKSIYILLRPKKGIEPDKRKDSILNKKIFNKLKAERPELIEKVKVVAGDVSLPDLGMNLQDLNTIIEEVSIVFHCAAIISFLKPLRYVLLHNGVSTNTVIQLSKKFKKLDVLVYTSTSFANINRLTTIEEEIYRLPFPAQKFLDALKDETDERLEKMASECKPDWPNAYAFSKCFAENIILDNASDMPVAIIRPSIVICTWKGKTPGYVEEGSGISALSIGVGKGFIKVLQADRNCEMNLIPADVVVNAHVVAGWSVATGRVSSPFVVHCTADDDFLCTLAYYTETMVRMAREFLLPKSYQKLTSLKIVKNDFLYRILSIYEHYAPAFVFDILLRIYGKKPRLVSLYQFLDKASTSLKFYLSPERKWVYERNNICNLQKQLHPDDEKVLGMDLKEGCLTDIARSLVDGSPFYEWKIDKKSPAARKRIVNQRYWINNFIKGLALTFLCYLVCKLLNFVWHLFPIT